MDSDTTTRAGDHARILAAFGREADVLVGTQMVAKGLDYPTVTLAAVVAADMGLNLPDFRAAERSFALFAQVCGRSGRNRRGDAIIQTYVPEHSAVRFAAAARLRDFAGGRAARTRKHFSSHPNGGSCTRGYRASYARVRRRPEVCENYCERRN